MFWPHTDAWSIHAGLSTIDLHLSLLNGSCSPTTRHYDAGRVAFCIAVPTLSARASRPRKPWLAHPLYAIYVTICEWIQWLLIQSLFYTLASPPKALWSSTLFMLHVPKAIDNNNRVLLPLFPTWNRFKKLYQRKMQSEQFRSGREWYESISWKHRSIKALAPV